MTGITSIVVLVHACNVRMLHCQSCHVTRACLDACGQVCRVSAAQLSLSLEKLNFIKLRELHRVACDAEDAQLADFIGAHPMSSPSPPRPTRSGHLNHAKHDNPGAPVVVQSQAHACARRTRSTLYPVVSRRALI